MGPLYQEDIFAKLLEQQQGSALFDQEGCQFSDPCR
jgi:hypothetical protein